MIFSVFDYKRNAYDYYEVQSDSPPTAWFRRPADAVNGNPDGVFFSTEALAVRLPSGATKIGTGSDARGVVATTEAGVGASDPAGTRVADESSPPRGLLLGVLIGWVAAQFFRRRA